jgi:hypothetical protein
MTKPMIRIHDVQTGEIIDREMTIDEITDLQTNAAALKTLEDAHKAKATQKAALLERLGITEDEAKLLLG